MRVAAYQAPLSIACSMDALKLIKTQIERCEAEGVTILCCPEGILGGLADYNEHPAQFAIPAGQLNAVLASLTSNTVTTILGFTELADDGRLYNSAAVFQQGSVAGLYRKLHPAIRRSIYEAGCDCPIFRARDLTFGIVICNDSNYSEPAQRMAAQGATALFVPTNNSLPLARACPELVMEARSADIARAVENGMWVIRADVAGRTEKLMSYGSSGFVDPYGSVMASAKLLSGDLVIAEIGTVPHARRNVRAARRDSKGFALGRHTNSSGGK